MNKLCIQNVQSGRTTLVIHLRNNTLLNVNRQNEHGIKCCATADVNEPGFISIDEVDL